MNNVNGIMKKPYSISVSGFLGVVLVRQSFCERTTSRNMAVFQYSNPNNIISIPRILTKVVILDMTNATFLYNKHVDYIKFISQDKDSFEFVVTEHLRMSGVYWGLTAMAILGRDLRTEMDSDTIVDWVTKCYQEEVGG